jgi:hypothetical protein
MTVFLVITAVAYLAGAVSGAFLVIVSGIRRGDRPERILNSASARSSRRETCARCVLRTGTWPDAPVYRPSPEDD